MSDVDKFYNRICGKLLGDGCITKQKENHDFNLYIEQKILDGQTTAISN